MRPLSFFLLIVSLSVARGAEPPWLVNIGDAGNDRQGDSLRVAFDKINKNARATLWATNGFATNLTIVRLHLPDLTPDRAAAISPSGYLTNALTTITELNYLIDARRNIQEQIDELIAGGGGDTNAVTGFHVLDDLASLRALPFDSSFKFAATRGLLEPWDYGGADYLWGPDLTSADDGSVIIRPDDVGESEPGRWVNRAQTLPPTISTGLYVVDTFETLRQLPADPSNKQAAVQGNLFPRDGQGGIYTWDPDSTETDDEISVCKPVDLDDSEPGRWIFLL